jgi:alpha-glucuronidase
MVDDSINSANAVKDFYAAGEPNHDDNVKTFVKAAQGDLTAKAPFNYGHANATAFDMMFHSLNTRGGVTLATVFAYVAKQANEGCDEAEAMLKTMADQFMWCTS